MCKPLVADFSFLKVQESGVNRWVLPVCHFRGESKYILRIYKRVWGHLERNHNQINLLDMKDQAPSAREIGTL